ncbi:MAG TPA: BON domain-containing protein [Longimicrobiales bacterium]
MAEGDKKIGSLALKIGIASAIGFGAIATGLFVSRRGRHLVKEAFQGRERTRLEDRVLDTLWGDPVIGRRDIDVDELDAGVVALFGDVRSEQERRVALALARQVKGIEEVQDHLQVVPRQKKQLARRRTREVRE